MQVLKGIACARVGVTLPPLALTYLKVLVEKVARNQGRAPLQRPIAYNGVRCLCASIRAELDEGAADGSVAQGGRPTGRYTATARRCSIELSAHADAHSGEHMRAPFVVLMLVAIAAVAVACGPGDTKPTVPPSPPAQSNCNPNYSGACLDKPGDYDCAGGSGNGPNYTGRVTVIGADVYGLDRDGDGVACG